MPESHRRVALITGGSRGIGLGIAQALARNEWDLAINGVRTESEVQTVLQDLRRLGAEVVYCQGDLGQAVEAFKLAILRHKAAGWQETSCDSVLTSLEALKQLVQAPSDDQGQG